MSEPVLTGVELGGTKCVCVLAKPSGEILAQKRVPTTTPEQTLPAIQAILRSWQESAAPFSALGIASFGPINVDPASPDWGRIGSTVKPGWTGAQVARVLGDEFAVPIALDTDVNGAALAEKCWGHAKGLDDFAYVTVGTGIGVGLISKGSPICGFSHGELGHMRIPRVPGDTWAGSCALHGDCVEGLAAGPAIAARTGTEGSKVEPDDPVWELVGHAIAQMLHNIVLTSTPRRIFVGGGVATAQPQLLAIVRRELLKSLNGYLRSPELDHIDEYVVPPGLGALAGPLGPIALARGVCGSIPVSRLHAAG